MALALSDLIAASVHAGRAWLSRGLAGLSVVLVSLVGEGGADIAAQPGQDCDLVLESDVRHPYGYRQRGERCEGIYVKNVAASPLQLRSLTRSFSELGDDPQPLHISWAPLAGQESNLHLRAQALRRRLYYRMDSARPMTDGEFLWPGELLTALQLGRQDLGLTAAAVLRIGAVLRRVYVPVALSQGPGASAGVRCELVLWPGVELSELFVTVVRLARNGRDSQLLLDQSPLGYGYYPAERPIRVHQPEICTAGLYRMEIGALHRGTGSSTLELWIASAGG